MTNIDFSSIPYWVIEKNHGHNKWAVAACLLAIDAGSIAVVRETPKAVLVEWGNTELIHGPAGGEFWVAKSLIKEI